MIKILSKIKPYIWPSNTLDQSCAGRLKLGCINYSGVNSWWNIKPLQAWLRKRDYQFKCAIDNKKFIIVTSGDDITHLWVANEVLIEKVYDLSVVPFEPDLIFDFGANIGLFSLLSASKWPEAKIVCVEPHPVTFKYLTRNLDFNGIKGVKLQCALDDHPGVQYLQNQGAVFQAVSDKTTSTFTYCLKLDAFLESFDDGRLLIKMDIEGAEEKVLDSLSVKLPEETFVFIELHRGETSLTWIKQWASKNAFRFVEVRRRDQAIDGFLVR